MLRPRTDRVLLTREFAQVPATPLLRASKSAPLTGCWFFPSRQPDADGHQRWLARSAVVLPRYERASQPLRLSEAPWDEPVDGSSQRVGGQAYALWKSMSFTLGRSQMAHRHTVSTAILVASLTLGASGCGGDDDPGNDPSARPTTSSATATPTPTDSTSLTPDPGAWRAEYTKEQLAEYDRAAAAWVRFGELQDKYQRDPVDRETAQELYEKYTHNAAALTASYEAAYINGGVRTLTPPEPLTRTVRKIEVGAKGSLVEFDQCFDYTTVDIRQNGKPLVGALPTENDTAIIRIQMDSDAKGDWRVFSTKVVDKPCE